MRKTETHDHNRITSFLRLSPQLANF
jgi:hypothetical protein